MTRFSVTDQIKWAKFAARKGVDAAARETGKSTSTIYRWMRIHNVDNENTRQVVHSTTMQPSAQDAAAQRSGDSPYIWTPDEVVAIMDEIADRSPVAADAGRHGSTHSTDRDPDKVLRWDIPDYTAHVVQTKLRIDNSNYWRCVCTCGKIWQGGPSFDDLNAIVQDHLLEHALSREG